MTRVIGVRFRTAGKIYYFDPGNFDIKKGDHVIVETARGVEYGTVLSDPKDVEDDEVTKPLKAVLRMANDKDNEQEKNNRIREKEAFKICKDKIIKHGLEMKLIDAEYTFDNNKVLFYFTADGRIDFRDLVKDLASEFKTRIELRQIGVRDETKIIGGYGICGRPLCCHSYLSDFIPVSIKMAKEQNLSLNPTKISGVCGRLMCCLKNEEDVYEELNRKMPQVGDIVRTNDDLEGEVASVNILRQTVRILVDVDDEKEVHEANVDDLTLVRKKQKHKQNGPKEKDADEEAAKALEQQDKDITASEKPTKNRNHFKDNQERKEDRNQDKNRERAQDRSQEKNRDNFQTKGQEKDRDNNQSKSQDNNLSKSQGNNQSKGQEKSQDNIQSKIQEKNQDNNQSKSQDNNQTRGQEKSQDNNQAKGQNKNQAFPANSKGQGGQSDDQTKAGRPQKNFDKKNNNKKKNFNKKNRNNRGKNLGNQDNNIQESKNQNRGEENDGKN